MGLAVHLSEQGKDIKKDGYQEIRTVKDPGYDPSFSSAAAPPPRREPTYAVQLKTRPDSLRGIYKGLKSRAK